MANKLVKRPADDLRVEVRSYPAPVGKAAVGVFRWGTGRLDNTVEADDFGNDGFHGACPTRAVPCPGMGRRGGDAVGAALRQRARSEQVAREILAEIDALPAAKRGSSAVAALELRPLGRIALLPAAPPPPPRT